MTADPRDDGSGEPTGPPGDQPRDEDALWREIVDNYGDEPTVDDPPVADRPNEPSQPGDTQWFTLSRPEPRPRPEDEHYIPPTPPPLPQPTGLRLVAWLGVLGVPVLVLILLLTGISLPSWGGFLCLVWFVGGFGYLVANMRRGDEDDGDDGARI